MQFSTIHPKNNAFFAPVVLCCGYVPFNLPISFRIPLLASWQASTPVNQCFGTWVNKSRQLVSKVKQTRVHRPIFLDIHHTCICSLKKSPWCQLCRHWWHWRLSWRQTPVPPVTTELASCHNISWNVRICQKLSDSMHWSLRSVSGIIPTPCMLISQSSIIHRILQWRHNERDGVSNHQPHDCLLSLLFRRRSQKTSKLRVPGLCAGNSPVTDEFPAQRASNAENISIWWRHHDMNA